MGMGGRIGGQWGYHQSPYGGGYPAGPGKGRSPYGIPSQNAYYDENHIGKLTKEDPYGLIPYKEPVQTPPPATAPSPPATSPPPPTQTEQVPGRPTRGLAGFGPQAEGFPRGTPFDLPPNPFAMKEPSPMTPHGRLRGYVPGVGEVYSKRDPTNYTSNASSLFYDASGNQLSEDVTADWSKGMHGETMFPGQYDFRRVRELLGTKPRGDGVTWGSKGSVYQGYDSPEEAMAFLDQYDPNFNAQDYQSIDLGKLHELPQPPPTPTTPTLERTNIFGQTADEFVVRSGDELLTSKPQRPRFYGGPGKGMRPQPYGGGFGGYQQPFYGGGFGGGFGGYQQPFYGGGFGGYPRSPYGGGFGGGVFSQGYGVPRGIASLLSNYPSYMPPRMPFNPYAR